MFLDSRLQAEHYRRMNAYALKMDYDASIESSDIHYADLFRAFLASKDKREKDLLVREMNELIEWDAVMLRGKFLFN